MYINKYLICCRMQDHSQTFIRVDSFRRKVDLFCMVAMMQDYIRMCKVHMLKLGGGGGRAGKLLKIDTIG